jgi:hypothetical protein
MMTFGRKWHNLRYESSTPMGNDKLMMQQRRRALKYFVREDTLQ